MGLDASCNGLAERLPSDPNNDISISLATFSNRLGQRLTSSQLLRESLSPI
jgi:hypothetical protein